MFNSMSISLHWLVHCIVLNGDRIGRDRQTHRETQPFKKLAKILTVRSKNIENQNKDAVS